jgi:hypothetical protein
MFYLPNQTMDVVKPFGSTMKKASKKEVEARNILWPRNWDSGYRRPLPPLYVRCAAAAGVVASMRLLLRLNRVRTIKSVGYFHHIYLMKLLTAAQFPPTRKEFAEHAL